jgi:hypothetical protein
MRRNFPPPPSYPPRGSHIRPTGHARPVPPPRRLFRSCCGRRTPRPRPLNRIVEDADIVRERAARVRDRDEELAHALRELHQLARGHVGLQHGVHVGGVQNDDVAPLAGEGC